MEQMTLFDFIRPETRDFHEMTEDECVALIGKSIGVQFNRDDNIFGWYKAKVGKAELTCHYSHYSIGDKRIFISCGWSTNTSGCGSPCDSLDEAIAFFKKCMKSSK